MNYKKLKSIWQNNGVALLSGSLGAALMLSVLSQSMFSSVVCLIAAGGLLVCSGFAFLHGRQTRKDYYALQAKESVLDVVFDNIEIGISVFDKQLRLLELNSRYAELMEIEEEKITPQTTLQDILSWNFDNYIDAGDDREAFIADTLEYLDERVSGKIDRHFANGKIIEASFNVCPDGGYILTVSDVTATRLADKTLRENEDRYRSMVELSPDAIVAHKGGFIIYVNEAALALFKLRNRHDLIGQKISSYFPYADREALAPYFGSADDAEAVKNLSALKSKVIREDGGQTDVEMEATVLLYGEDNILQLVIRDISAQMQIEDFLKQAKDEAEYAAQIKGKFLANMSHELRTPLNAVIGFSEVIISQIFGPVGSGKYLEYAHDINASGLHLLELINDILDFSKIEAGEQKINEEKVEIDVLVNECIRLTQQRAIENDINIKLEFDPLLPQIFADRRMIKQILINLLSNAVKFTPTGGRIITSVQLVENEGMKISVSDNGIGLREGDIERALTPFVQVDSEKNRKYQGTGLGLPLSKNLAEMHEGRLELLSKYGEGTVVTLYLPRDRICEKAA
ncbi:PAS domain-containing sensor histidine kinase [Sneathiella sp. HT1-7]|uniref:sensor histidine kinase n=1 Tax=Sneathiella sp. HT1-7 TaxID=2887192 RepID=UPI001D146B87|nr:ATP-binding protein [Sneathiella sp. HT1-7]MCC3306003.1 PAS-domain containing protein [Sneathiella sp. HT1-7]